MKSVGLLFLVLPLSVWSQKDSIIYAVGDVVDPITKQPVVSNITFRSLPYSSKVGVLTGSSFSIPLYDNESYSISAEAKGYIVTTITVDPSKADTSGKVVKNIELNLQVMRLDRLIFETGKSKILSSSYPELSNVINMLKTNSKMIIQLEGHTDIVGDPKKNMKLSEARVNEVKKYLVEKGADGKRILTKAFGSTKPLSHANTEEAHSLNRRVELRIIQ